MNENTKIIAQFYTAFANQDAETMARCYHENIQFEDPVFGILKGKKPAAMWAMLIERSKGQIQIEFSNTQSDAKSGAATWVATYNFSKTNRKVVNVIQASFEFQDGLISKHTDVFDLWRWSRQAFGLKGWLLGWTNFMQHKIQEQAKLSLEKYCTKST
jgi:limonene-1,2-epoxide hydrolase